MTSYLEIVTPLLFFSIFGRFGAIQKQDSGRIVCKTYFFNNNNFLSYQKWKDNYIYVCTNVPNFKFLAWFWLVLDVGNFTAPPPNSKPAPQKPTHIRVKLSIFPANTLLLINFFGFDFELSQWRTSIIPVGFSKALFQTVNITVSFHSKEHIFLYF